MKPTEHRPAIGRRRALSLFAAAGAMAVAGPAAMPTPTCRWQGTALGAPAELQFAGADHVAAERAVSACLAEIERLEDQFSLFRPDSALSRLNRDGELPAPTADMRALLGFCRWLGERSDGAFDVTVQPLWQLHAAHFAAPAPAPQGPDARALDAVRQRIDYRKVVVLPDRVVVPPGMAVTLNGIAQGYITDRVAARLRRLGWSHVLLQLGELRGLDGRGSAAPWLVDTPAGVLPVADRAVAVSAGAGTPLSADGRHHHLFDPATGRSSRHYRSVTVVAPSATLADGLSTALTAMAPAPAQRLIATMAATEAHLILADGRHLALGA